MWRSPLKKGFQGAKGLRKKLLSFASRPGKDFTRRRALGFEDIVLLLLTVGIETSFRSLKYTVGLIHLHSKIPMLILQEIFAAFLVFNFTKAVSWGVEMP